MKDTIEGVTGLPISIRSVKNPLCPGENVYSSELSLDSTERSTLSVHEDLIKSGSFETLREYLLLPSLKSCHGASFTQSMDALNWSLF